MTSFSSVALKDWICVILKTAGASISRSMLCAVIDRVTIKSTRSAVVTTQYARTTWAAGEELWAVDDDLTYRICKAGAAAAAECEADNVGLLETVQEGLEAVRKGRIVKADTGDKSDEDDKESEHDTDGPERPSKKSKTEAHAIVITEPEKNDVQPGSVIKFRVEMEVGKGTITAVKNAQTFPRNGGYVVVWDNSAFVHVDRDVNNGPRFFVSRNGKMESADEVVPEDQSESSILKAIQTQLRAHSDFDSWTVVTELSKDKHSGERFIRTPVKTFEFDSDDWQPCDLEETMDIRHLATCVQNVFNEVSHTRWEVSNTPDVGAITLGIERKSKDIKANFQASVHTAECRKIFEAESDLTVVFGYIFHMLQLFNIPPFEAEVFGSRRSARNAPPTATGGRATGGRATGGRATGGRATGGRATGGRATGGRATGDRSKEQGQFTHLPLAALPPAASVQNTEEEAMLKEAGTNEQQAIEPTAQNVDEQRGAIGDDGNDDDAVSEADLFGAEDNDDISMESINSLLKNVDERMSSWAAKVDAKRNTVLQKKIQKLAESASVSADFLKLVAQAQSEAIKEVPDTEDSNEMATLDDLKNKLTNSVRSRKHYVDLLPKLLEHATKLVSTGADNLTDFENLNRQLSSLRLAWDEVCRYRQIVVNDFKQLNSAFGA